MKFVVICFNHKRCQKKSVEDTFISIVVTLTAIIRKPSNRYNSCFMCTPTLPVPGVQIGGRQGTVERDVSPKKQQRGGGIGVRALFSSLFFPRSLPSRHTPLSERLERSNNNNVACPTDRTRLIIRVRLHLLSRLQKRNYFCIVLPLRGQEVQQTSCQLQNCCLD